MTEPTVVARWLHLLASAAGSATSTVLIAIIFLCVPNIVAFMPMTEARRAATGTSSCKDHTIVVGDSLERVSTLEFGEPGFGWSILLATNMRAGSPAYEFIAQPLELPVGKKLCVPDRASAETLARRYDTYASAVRVAMLSEPPKPSHPLLRLAPGEEVTLVTWTRDANAKQLVGSQALPRETWVTVAPMLQSVCRAYARQHTANADALALRLEQRLGLPPGSNNTQFVEFKLSNPKTFSPKIIFRPCSEPRTDSISCATRLPPHIGPFDALASSSPTGGEEFEHWFWFLSKYYTSFGLASPYQYPWTAAGYTFDWAPRQNDPELFEKWGESEFVVAEGATIREPHAKSTAEYCAP